MPISLPPSVVAALNAEQVSNSVEALVTITDSSLDTPLRLTTCTGILSVDTDVTRGIVSNGETYLQALTDLTLPDQTDDGSQSTDIVIDNIEFDLGLTCRALTPDANVTLGLFLASDPDTVFATVEDLAVVGRAYDLNTITLSVSRQANRPGRADMLEPLAGERQTWIKAPGLHR